MASCRYAMHGGCPLKKVLHCFKTVQGGTWRLELHTSSQKATDGTVRFQHQLPDAALSEVASAAASAASLGGRPLSFCDGQVGMRQFA